MRRHACGGDPCACARQSGGPSTTVSSHALRWPFRSPRRAALLSHSAAAPAARSRFVARWRFAEQLGEAAACPLGLRQRFLGGRGRGSAEQSIERRPGLPGPVLRAAVGVGARLKVAAEVGALLVLHLVGYRFAALTTDARIEVNAQATDMQVCMTGAALAGPSEWHYFSNRGAAAPAYPSHGRHPVSTLHDVTRRGLCRQSARLRRRPRLLYHQAIDTAARKCTMKTAVVSA